MGYEIIRPVTEFAKPPEAEVQQFIQQVKSNGELSFSIQQFFCQLHERKNLAGDWKSHMDIDKGREGLWSVRFTNSDPKSSVLLETYTRQDLVLPFFVYRADVGGPVVLQTVHPVLQGNKEYELEFDSLLGDRSIEWQVQDHTNDGVLATYKSYFQQLSTIN